MTSILTITLNPAVDFATSAPSVFPGRKLRCKTPRLDPGGGGINVARAIRNLGGEAQAFVAIGGNSGAQMLELLAFEGVSCVAIQGPGDTRRSFSVIDESNGEQYRFVTPGPDWAESDVNRALAGLDRAARDGALMVLSGSQPPGVAKDFPAMLAEHVRGRGARLIVDTSGLALHHLAEDPQEAIYVLRMNVEEAEELAGRALPTRADTAEFARGLVDKGVAQMIVVARGSDGSVLAARGGRAWHSTSPKVKVVSPIGAGDSFVGAFTLALAEGKPPQECLRWGAAAASAAVASDATELCRLQDFERLLPECELTEI